LTVLPAEPGRRGYPVIAWSFILVIVAGIVVLQTIRPPRGGPEIKEDTALVTMQLQARYLVGAASLLGSNPTFYTQAQTMNVGTVDQRLRFIALAGELAGPNEALKQLQELEQKLDANQVKPTEAQLALMKSLEKLYLDYGRKQFEAPSLTAVERDRLRDQLGWFGELALAPAGTLNQAAREEVLAPARRTVFAIGITVGVLFLVGLIGFGALIVFLIFLFVGRLQTGIRLGAPHHAIYAETFALWLLLFVGISLVNALLPATRWALLQGGVSSLLSLTALLWPVLRGIPWRQVRWEVGLRAGRQPALEPFIGLANYAMALPLVALGLVMTLVLMFMQRALQGGGNPQDSFAPTDMPSHPIFKDIVAGDWGVRLQVLLLASVFAPIVEETMFRGVLYRHLREASQRLGFFWSVVVSSTVAGFLFAVIHPQGLVAIPGLMAVAYGLTLVREWRGTLIPGMVTHGVHNGVLMLFAMLAMGD
jgi:membrane protease YdiL (CAAX protease family)